MRTNLTKNRYTDVLCYDHSRVVLAYEDGIELSDYINANFVDGYKQKNAYISTQGGSGGNNGIIKTTNIKMAGGKYIGNIYL